MSPATGWRVGLGLPEVDAGYAIAREHDGENGERSVRDDLVARLEAGTDVALIGPPGSGKSTVCKRVACRWREREDGVVLYREGGMGQSFESPTILEALLERTRGPTLVVVEDAIRTDANAIFDVMRSVSGREDVVFLLDARESEWLDPEGDHIDTRLEAFRQEAIETVTVPRLAERDCVRLLDRFEKLTGEQLDVSVWDLVDDIQNASRGDDLATSGTMFLLFHRLSRYVDPLVEYEGAEMPTTLDADVGRLRSDLDDIGETAFDVGVLVNLLNATGMGVYPEYVHAVATATEDRADAGERAAVRAALDRLEGHVLFASPDDSGPVYRAVHSTWSVRFLAHLLETDRQATTRRVGRCLSALFSLADDTDRRRSIADLVGGESEALDAIVTDPTDWADETVVRLFGLGRAYPKFAPLFGTTAASEIDLPDACSTDVPLRCTMLRGRMLLRAGSLDGAEREFDRLEAASQSLPSPKAERFRFESVSGQCEIMRRRGENEAAAAYARRGLDLARTAGDERAEIRSLRTQATVAKTRGDLERASAHLSECLELLETVDAPHEEAKTAEAFGVVSRDLGAYDDATAYFERSRAIFHDVGDRRGESKALGSLGNMATKRQRYEEAREYLLRALEIARDVGDPIIEASHLGDLGGLALMRGEITEARRYFEQVIPIAAETDKALLRRALSNRGAIARHLGNFDDAQEYFDRALECAREIGIDKAEAETLRNRALLRIREHRPFDAEEDAQRALEIARTVGDPKLKAECLEFLGYARIKAGAFESAEDPLQRALEIAREMGHPKREAEILGFLADVARGTGDLEGAEAYARDACALHENVDAPASATTRSILGHVAIDREAFDTAKACFSKALDAYRTMGFRPGIAEVLVARAHVARRTGEFDLAERSVSEGVEIAREDGYPVVEARGLLERGAIARDRRHFEDASTALERALETFREHDARYYEAGALFELGRLESERGNLDRARTRLAESADHYLEMGTNQRAIRVLESLRDVCERQEDHDAVATWRERRAELAAEAEFDAPPRALRE